LSSQLAPIRYLFWARDSPGVTAAKAAKMPEAAAYREPGERDASASLLQRGAYKFFRPVTQHPDRRTSHRATISSGSFSPLQTKTGFKTVFFPNSATAPG